MKVLRSLTTFVGIVVCICGCATTGTNGVVQIGPDTYMIGGLGQFTDFSGSAVKARLYQQAAEFCRSKGGVMGSFEQHRSGLETLPVRICGDSVQVCACG